MGNTVSTTCPIKGTYQTAAKIIEIGEYNIAWLESSKMWTTVDIPSVDTLSSAYQSFGAGQHSRDNFNLYMDQSRTILKGELSKAGRSAACLKGLRLLDYGCGGGHFVAAAQSLGIDPMGLELDSDSVQQARKVGLNVIEGFFPRDLGKFSGKKFDVIKVSHVLEHVPNLSELIQSLVSLLDSNGLLIINVPNQKSFPARFKILLRRFGIRLNDYGYVQPPIHLHGFTKETFSVIAKHFSMNLLTVYEYSPLDNSNFPTTEKYWKRAKLQRAIYRIAHLVRSEGYMTAILKK